MEVWLHSCWTALWTVVLLLKGVSSDPSSQTRYTLSRADGTFDDAMRGCSPGVLTSTATEQEVQQVLELLSRSVPDQEDLTVWIGLRKNVKQCTDPSLPLRGFSWVDSGSQDSKVNTWLEEPKRSCTELRCAALKLQFTRSTARLGLVPVSCKTHFQYICRVEQGRVFESPSTTTGPAATSPELEQTAETRPATVKPSPTEPEPLLPSPAPEAEPSPGSGPCQYTTFSSIRSFILDSSNSSRMQVECWSDTRLDLFCSGDIWLTLDGSPVDFSSVCQKCPPGFQKDASGRCEDVDECGSGEPCRHTCLNTEGSFSCVCADGSDRDSSCSDPVPVKPDQSSLLAVLVPVLAAFAGLLVLVAVVAVTMKCWVRRRRRRRSEEKESDGKETT